MTKNQAKEFVDKHEEEMEIVLKEYTIRKWWEGFTYGVIIMAIIVAFCETFLK